MQYLKVVLDCKNKTFDLPDDAHVWYYVPFK